MIKKNCALCDTEVEELYKCERCDLEICSDCCNNQYPYNNTICNDCESSFMDMLETWKGNEEPIKWKQF